MFRREPGIGSVVKVSEAGAAVIEPPRWVEYFVSLGFNWPIESDRQRLCFISTPCDSQAAGLIALGLIMQRLGQRRSDDANQHLSNLSIAAKRKRGKTIFRHRTRPGLFEAVVDASGRVRFKRMGKEAAEEHFLLEANAVEWAIDGQPHIQVRDLDGALSHAGVYSSLMPEGISVHEENLRRSDSVVVFAGRSSGSTATKEHLQRLVFRCDSDAADLAELLSIHAWSDTKVSRMRYLTSRRSGDNCASDRFDRPGLLPRLVVADGVAAFGAARSSADGADIIAVIDRSSDLQSLDEMGATVADLRQWYDDGDAPECKLPSPAGVVVRSLFSRDVL